MAQFTELTVKCTAKVASHLINEIRSFIDQGSLSRSWSFDCALVMLATMVALNLFAEGEPKMPTLNWMGREKATKSVKDVVMKILREDKSLGYCCQCENVASTNANSQLGNGNIGIGNTPTMATFDKLGG